MIAARALVLVVFGAWGCGRSIPVVIESAVGTSAPTERTLPAEAAPSRSAVPGGAAPGSAAPPAARASVSAVQPRAGAACRVMRVTGDVRRDRAPLVVGTRLDGAPALELAANSSLHLVHTQSTRQWVVTGPARLVACEAGAEELALALGQVRLEPGSGVRPGAEVWIGTPFGSLRYADARAELSVGARELSL